MESSDDAIVGKDLNGVIRSWNAGAEAIFGYTAAQAIGQPIQMLFPPDRLAEEDEIAARIRRGERVEHHETVRRRRDGVDIPVSISVSPILDASGRIVGASKILRDISEQRRVQLELLRAKADLERLVEERSQALMQRDLLLREVYHRVKNNLQVIDGMLMLLLQRTQDPPAREGIGDLRARVLALGLVHQQLMGSSDLKTFDVAPFLRQLMDNLVGGAGGDGIELRVDACALSVGLDFAIPLGLVVTEIVTNALKHAFPDGVGVVQVSLRLDGDDVLLTVGDNGPGFAEAPGPPTAGVGRGLIGRLVAQLDGDLAIRQDAGTTFEIRLPRPETA